ncbi:MAG: Gfo/Idh/MocA family oxidoreductase [Pirellulales bacterium]|nr:Gfo/Idh/MocA family oxidoreductase [Pirellulales bacterium]
MTSPENSTRREFLKTSSALAAGAALAGGLNFARTAHAAGSDLLKVALIGCGSRGKGAAHDILDSCPGVKIVALADAFEDRAKDALDDLRKTYPDKIDLPEERIFAGLDAYQKAIHSGVDLVLLVTPPGFRPLQYAAAVEAGKHVFMEKPCCTDAPGYRWLLETNRKADEKGLKVVVGLQRRHQPHYVRDMPKIHDGKLGEILFMRAYWNGWGIWTVPRDPRWTEMQYQVHNWYHFVWTCGDHIVEQHVHNLDICNWAMQGKIPDVKNCHPVEAVGMGSCCCRDNRGMGQIFDNHTVEFTYADGTKLFSQCRQQDNTCQNVSEHVHGTKKTWHSPRNAYAGAPYKQEHIDLVDAIRNHKPLNDGWHAAIGSFTGVLGRMATYSGQRVKWDDAAAKGPDEMPKTYAWDAPPPVLPDKDGNYPMPVPGINKPYEME